MEEKEFLIAFYRYLEDNKLINGTYGAEKIAQGFTDKYHLNVEDLKIKLEVMPEKIMQKEQELLNKRNEQTELGVTIKSIEASTMQIVTNETIDVPVVSKKGEEETVLQKPKYTNNQQREIETKNRLESDRNYIEASGKLKELNLEIANLVISIDFLKRNFRAAEAILSMH